MANFKCLECKHLVSSEAETCPDCGASVKSMIAGIKNRPRAGAKNQKKTPSKIPNEWKVGITIIAMAVVSTILFVIFFDRNTSGADAFTNSPGIGYVDTSGMEHPNPQSKNPWKNQFSAWDGSHIMLTRMIKGRLHDPSSYDHMETT